MDVRIARIALRLRRSVLYRINKVMRVAYMLRNTLLDGAPFSAVVAGVKLRLSPRGLVAYHVWSRYQVENDEIAFIARHLQPGQVFCDVGSNVGLFSLVGAMMATRGQESPKIIAFEPTPDTYRTLTVNIELNGLSCIETVNAAVGACDGMATLYINDSWNDGMNALVRPQRSNVNVVSEVQVPVVELTKFLHAREIKQIDFFKIDVEGAELAVLEGARRLLEQSPDCIIIFECYVPNAAAFGYHPEKILQFLRGFGFDIWLFGENGKLRPVPVNCYQGNMLAGRPEKLAQLGLDMAAK